MLCTDPRFLDFGISWGWVVSFTPRPLYPRGKIPQCPLDRRLGGPQSRSGRRGEEKMLDPIGTRTPTPRSSSQKPVAIPTALSRLFCFQVCVLFRIFLTTYHGRQNSWFNRGVKSTYTHAPSDVTSLLWVHMFRPLLAVIGGFSNTNWKYCTYSQYPRILHLKTFYLIKS
jgi:hypothetical protein